MNFESMKSVKRIRKVAGAWVDPWAVQAATRTTAGKVRLQLSGGGVVDISVADGESVDSVVSKLFPKEET